MKLFAFGLCAILATCALDPSLVNSADKVFTGTGVALTPKDFPRHTNADVRGMFEEGKKLGDYAVFIYQWSQPDMHKVAAEMMEVSQKFGLTPVIAISPTILGGARGEYDAPESVRKKVKGRLSFANDKVHKPYIQAVIDLAKLKPPYLCLATEINFLAFADIKEYVTFAHVFKKLYPVIKEISPETKVFVSFQWDFYYKMDADEPDKIKEHTKLIDVFRPELDLVAFTSYPGDHFSTPADIPGNYYEKVFNHVTKSEEVLFMEIGWPTEGRSNEAEQREFIERLPILMSKVKPSILAWSLLHDVNLSALGGTLAATGLITTSGEAKQGFKAFAELRAH